MPKPLALVATTPSRSDPEVGGFVPSPPQKQTLAKYGLTAEEWLALCQKCNYTCYVCGKPFGDRPLVVDHEHVKGFKAIKVRKIRGAARSLRSRVMPPEERKLYVRGVLHNYCNRFVRKWLTLERARAIVEYLERYHKERER